MKNNQRRFHSKDSSTGIKMSNLKRKLFIWSFLVILLGIIFPSVPLFAQSTPPIHFTHFTTDDGLPHDIGYQMIEDDQGYLWIGTDNGLARFDGNSFKTFGDEAGLTNPYAIDITNSKTQHSYIGTWGNGIFKKTQDTITPLPLLLNSQKIARLNYQDPEFLEIWTRFGFTELGYHTYTKNLYYFDNKKLYHVLICKKNDTYYKSIEEKIQFKENIKNDSSLVKVIDQNSFIKSISPNITTQDKEKIYLTNEGAFKTVSQTLPLESIRPYSLIVENPGELWRTTKLTLLKPIDERIKGISITSIVEDQTGGIWLGSKGTLYYLGADGILTSYPSPSPHLSPVELTIWQGKYLAFFTFEDRSKLFLLDLETSKIHEIGHQLGLSATISDLFQDKEENLWMTTDGAGLFCIKPFSTRNYGKEAGLENSFIYDLVEAKNGTIYAATKKGLYYYSEDHWNKIEDPNVNVDLHGGIEINSKGNLILGTGANLKKTIELEIPSQKINELRGSYLGRTFYLDRKDRIWSIKIFDLFNALYKTNREKKLIEIYKENNWGKGFSEEFLTKFFKIQEIRNDRFTALEVDESTMLMGTSRGLFEVIGDSLKHFSKEDGLPSSVINDIVQSKDGNVWIATEKGICLKKGNQFSLFTTDGLVSLQIRQLLFDHKGQLWAGTPAGLHYYIFSEATWVPMTKHMGLIANDVTTLFEDSKQRIWIGTSRGMSMLPNKEKQKQLVPPLVSIEKMFINNQVIQNINEIKKIPFKSTLRVEYTAISLQSAKELIFRYRVNSEKKWQITNSRSFALFDLADGRYHLQIQAKKPNSNWSKAKTSSFIVKPPWYRSLWFMLLVGFVVLSIAQFIFLYRIRSERKKIETEVQLKEEMAQLEMKALQAQMNPHFIFNAMNSIMEFVMSEDKYSANQYLTKFSKLMRLFLDASKSNFNSLGDELELINLYVELEKLRYKDKFDFTISYDKELPIDLLEIPSIIIQPFIENAIQHGLNLKKDKGKLEMRISNNNANRLKIEIEDNGIGRDAALAVKRQSLISYKSHGTQIVKEKIDLLNSRQDDHSSVRTIDLKDHAGHSAGTRVILNISIQD